MRIAPRSLAGPAVVVLALLAIGCSGDDRDSGASSDSAPAPTSAEQREVPSRYEGHHSGVFADPANWICRPDMDDLCDSGLDSTVVDADGTLTVQPWTADDEAPIDCFYVYPTISTDPQEISDRVPGDAERFVTLNQAARLGEVCRVFAPVYRQRTLAALTAGLANPTTTVAGTAEPTPGEVDVRDAFAHYMANDNEGRGVVLIGHSQGASVLRGLIRDEIDPDDEVRDRLVAAYLAGSAVSVPAGEDVGGDFSNVALCRTDDQTGCVVSWASFRSDAPPPSNSLFGRPRSGDGVAACNSPAALSGGSAELHSYFPSSLTASILTPPGGEADAATASDEAGWAAGAAITTPFVSTPGLIRGECVELDGFNYLSVEVLGDPADPRADDIAGDLTPQWGLHLQDVNLVMGDIVELVRTQSAAWAARD